MTLMTPQDLKIDFVHRQSAHCESGVCSNLLGHHGLEISEAMAFGVGSGLFFGYLPFIRINKLPLTTYRCEVGGIFKRVARRLGCRVQWKKFKDPDAAMDALDEERLDDVADNDAGAGPNDEDSPAAGDAGDESEEVAP